MAGAQAGMVFLVSVREDDDEVAAIAHVLSAHGWLLRRITLTGDAEDALMAVETADAACVVLVWSSEAAKSARMTWVAERSHRRGALVATRLDDGVHIIVGTPGRVFDMISRGALTVDAMRQFVHDEADEMHRLLDLGVDGIMTDRPSVLRSVLVERGQWV